MLSPRHPTVNDLHDWLNCFCDEDLHIEVRPTEICPCEYAICVVDPQGNVVWSMEGF